MMNAQQLSHLAGLSGSPVRTLAAGAAWPLGEHGGRLEVLAGRVWLTQAGEIDDHVVEGGQTVCVAAAGRVVIEAWDDAQPALVVWRPRRAIDRAADGLRALFARCWDIVDPGRRVGLGSLAATTALVVGATLFGPVSDARSRALAASVFLHNGAAGVVAHDLRSSTDRTHDVAAAPSRERARVASQEARRRPPGAA